MSHILKKMQIAGGGKRRNEPKPPVYKPPVMGELQYGASFSYSEILDLISDGPIEGIVNRFGEVVDGLDILQGIYLDDTPVAVTQQKNKRCPKVGSETNFDANVIAETVEVQPSRLAESVGSGIKNCQLFFKAVNQQKYRSTAGLITALKKDNVRGPILDGEVVTLPNVNMIMVRQRTSNNRCQDRHPRSRHLRGVYYRAYIKKELEGAGSVEKRFFFWKNGNVRSEFNGNNNAVFRSSTEPYGDIDRVGWADCATYHRDNGFPAGPTSQTVKFYIGFGGNSMGYVSDGRRLWHNTEWDLGRVANGFSGSGGGLNLARHDNTNVMALRSILNLFNQNNSEGNLDSDALLIQRQLASKALGTLGWNPNHSFNGSQNGAVALIRDWMKKSANSRQKNWTCIVKVEENNPNLEGKSLFNAEGELESMFTYPYGLTNGWNLYFKMREAGIRIADVTCPVVEKRGDEIVATGKMFGFLLFQFAPSVRRDALRCSGNRYGWGINFAIPKKVKDLFADLDCFQYAKEIIPLSEEGFQTTNQKYNYSNVLAEFRDGSENQGPFNFFKAVFIDHKYGSQLFGPFSSKSGLEPQRILQNASMLTRAEVLQKGRANNYNLEVGSDGLPQGEGSDDERTGQDNQTRDYGSWAKDSLVHWDEIAIPTTHYVYNPNVVSCFITLNISNLNDTLIKEVDNVGGSTSSNNDLKIGTKFPTVLNIQVETGRVGEQGSELPFKTYIYRIVALIEGSTLIDIGNPDYKGESSKQFVVALNAANNLNIPFPLPTVRRSNVESLNSTGEVGFQADSIDQDSVEKRYIRVTKLSFESHSVLLNKDVSLDKVTEIINVDLPYPFSAIVGTKLDSRAFGSIPARSFDCKLKKVRVPSNYFPVVDGIDKRYWETQAKYNSCPKDSKLIYDGDWDGTFHNELRWTDNPAWILYDLLVNQRYGMGSHIDVDSINIWQLYEIGRFCDAVDENGYFKGVTDGRGGLEPRFSCNIVFDQGQKIYDAINTIANIFRGRAFFANSEITFVDDRPRTPLNLFTNETVKDGMFFYGNYRRDEQYNCIEVGFKDRFDNFAPKIEVIENEEDIRERGIFKKKIEGVGITSRAMARRVGQHEIFSRITENQTVAFTAGLESLLCQPGDLITIEDELKTNKANFGKILAVDLEAETIRLTNTFVDSDMNGILTVYNPTGRNSLSDIESGAQINRERYEFFTITGNDSPPKDMWVSGNTMFTGDYGFSGYTDGYADATREDDNSETRFEEYALYTGNPSLTDYPYIYFETGVTGWVFGSGNARNLYSGTFISQWTGAQALLDLSTGRITALDMTTADKRSTAPDKIAAFSGFDEASFVGPYYGVEQRQLPNIVGPDQMAILNVTGNIMSTPAELAATGLNNYGTLVSGVDKPELLPFLKLGSAAKFEIKDASPFIYKVVSLKEEAPNEYLVSATKYETGKFKLIEDDISIEPLTNTFSYQSSQTVNGVTYTTLDSPIINQVTTGIPNLADETFNITGTWGAVSNSTGYNIILTYPNGQTEDASVTTTDHAFTGLSQVGVFNYSVNALGNKGGSNIQNAYFDSQYSTSGIFVVYNELLTHSTSFLNQITIL